MAAEQDNKELSMAEILASIKKILADNEMGGKGILSTDTKKMPEVSLPVREEPKKSEAENVSAAFGNCLSCPKEFSIVEKDEILEQADDMQSPYVSLENNEHTSTEPTQTPKLQDEPKDGNVSEEIISSFTRMFEQNDFRRHAEQPQFDADALLRQIVNQAVAEKLNNKFLQNTIKETIVPVLEEWLSHYLPKLVAEEVERVMVKTGRR